MTAADCENLSLLEGRSTTAGRSDSDAVGDEEPQLAGTRGRIHLGLERETNGILKVSAKGAHENDSPQVSSYASNNSYGRPSVIFLQIFGKSQCPGVMCRRALQGSSLASPFDTFVSPEDLGVKPVWQGLSC